MKLNQLFGAMVALISAAMTLMPGTIGAQEVRTYFVGDVTGSPVAAMDTYANTVWSEDYTPYGERRVNAINAGDNHAWFTAGPQNEDSGLVALGNRYYDPAIGRFMSVDLVGVSPDDGSNFNRYAYANNNPYRYVDPSGEVPIIPIIIGVIWLADKAYAAYEAHQDYKAIQSGEQTVGQVVQRRSIEHAAGMALGPAGRWTAKAGVHHFIDDVGEGIVAKKVEVPRSRYPEGAAHIEDAQAAGHPSTLTIDRAGTAANRDAAQAGQTRVQGMDLDEYPPAMFREGGAGASVRPMTPAQNRGMGACIGNQCRGLPDGTPVQVIVVD
jgi:RHS repeat-associated protein